MLNEYQQMVEQHRHRIYSFAHYSLRTREDAEDVTQEVFIKLWQHWRKIDHDKIGGWLMRVAHNAVIDKVRKGKNGDANIDGFAEVDEQGQIEDPGAELDREEFKRLLQLAIHDLDEPFRSIVILRDIQGASYADIEECLGMSDSQVKVYLHRGRRKLRENSELRAMFAAAKDKRGVAAEDSDDAAASTD